MATYALVHGGWSGDKDLWAKPVYVNFHFKLMSGKLTEVSVSRP